MLHVPDSSCAEAEHLLPLGKGARPFSSPWYFWCQHMGRRDTWCEILLSTHTAPPGLCMAGQAMEKQQPPAIHNSNLTKRTLGKEAPGVLFYWVLWTHTTMKSKGFAELKQWLLRKTSPSRELPQLSAVCPVITPSAQSAVLAVGKGREKVWDWGRKREKQPHNIRVVLTSHPAPKVQ